MIRVLLSLILFGGVFIMSHLFYEYLNPAKNYFLLISSLLLLLGCFISRKGVQKLFDSLRSRGLFWGIAIVCLLVTLHGFLQFFRILPSYHRAFPITGTFENPAGFATVQAAMFPFVFYLCYDKESSRIQKIFALAISLMCLASVVLSGSRMGFLGICSAIMVILAFTDPVSSFFKTHRWAWIPILVICVSAFIALYYIKKDSADGRVFIWARCIDLIKERPLFGYGYYGFEHNYMSAQADYFRANPDSPYVMLADNVTQPFNEYLKLTVNYGIVGLTIAVILLIWIVFRLFKSDRQTKILGLSFVASVFVMCQFSYPYMYKVLWLLSFMAIAPAFIKPGKEFMIPGYLRIIVPSLLIGGLFLSLRTMYYQMKWTEISYRSIKGRAERMMPYYEDMRHIMRNNPLFFYNYAAELNSIQRYRESLEFLDECSKNWNDYRVQILYSDNYAKMGVMDSALIACDQAYNMIPSRFEPLYRKMLVYGISNDSINAVRMAYEIIEKPVKVRSEETKKMISMSEQVISRYDFENEVVLPPNEQ